MLFWLTGQLDKKIFLLMLNLITFKLYLWKQSQSETQLNRDKLKKVKSVQVKEDAGKKGRRKNTSADKFIC